AREEKGDQRVEAEHVDVDVSVPGHESPTEGDDAEASVLPPVEVRAVLEALVFASDQPITAREIGQVLGGVPREDWQAALRDLQADYARDGRGLQLVGGAGGWQDTARPGGHSRGGGA